jgi:4-diphosphocytidyl-2-C-methyl-D-erythritol kinase
VFLRVGLSDAVSVGPAPPGETADVLTVLDDPDCPVDGNLVLRAAALVRELTGAPLPPLALTLRKDVPVAAGLGGGSSDASAAFALACRAWGVGVDPPPDVVAARLGADVPFFRSGAGAAEVAGIGASVSPLPAPAGGIGLLLVTPRSRLSTARVFDAFDQLEPPGDTALHTHQALAAALGDGLSGTDLVAWSDRLAGANDLWPAAAAVDPELPRTRSDLERALGRRVLLSGSGPTLFALFPSSADAAAAGRTLATASHAWLSGARLAAVDDVGPHPAWGERR